MQELGGKGKLLCPIADQEEEYVAGRLDKEAHGDFLVLSLGVALRHRQGVFDYQAQLGMKAYVEQSETDKLMKLELLQGRFNLKPATPENAWPQNSLNVSPLRHL